MTLRARVPVAVAGSLVVVASVLTASVAGAEPPWVDRHITLPEHAWAFDLGIGIAHNYDPPRNDPTGAGLNFEMAVSPIDRLELGFRSGARLGSDARLNAGDGYGPDAYARLFDRQTFGTNRDDFANPELRIRGALLRSRIVEIGVEGRVFLPAEHGSELGLLFGIPFLFHLGQIARIDAGVYVPVVFYTPAQVAVSLPFDLWFQVTSHLWLGPMGGVVFDTNDNHAIVPFGFGLGYQIVRTVDLKTQFLFSDLNQTQGAQNFGVGVGSEVRIE
jgi:hypothetical protein